MRLATVLGGALSRSPPQFRGRTAPVQPLRAQLGEMMDVSRLSIQLLAMFSMGTLSGTQVQKLAMAAWMDGWGGRETILNRNELHARLTFWDLVQRPLAEPNTALPRTCLRRNHRDNALPSHAHVKLSHTLPTYHPLAEHQ